jgi:hypothetical protein
MQLDQIRSDRAVTRRDYLKRLVKSLGYLTERGRPVPSLLLRQLLRGSDDRDRVGEGRLYQNWVFRH